MPFKERQVATASTGLAFFASCLPTSSLAFSFTSCSVGARLRERCRIFVAFFIDFSSGSRSGGSYLPYHTIPYHGGTRRIVTKDWFAGGGATCGEVKCANVLMIPHDWVGLYLRRINLFGAEAITVQYATQCNVSNRPYSAIRSATPVSTWDMNVLPFLTLAAARAFSISSKPVCERKARVVQGGILRYWTACCSRS